MQKLLGDDDDDDHVAPSSAVQGLDAAALVTRKILLPSSKLTLVMENHHMNIFLT